MTEFILPGSTRQIDSLRHLLQSQTGLPFLEALQPAQVEAACRRVGYRWRDRLDGPAITLSLFLSQVLADDHSCDDVVDRLQKFRYDRHLPVVSSATTSYCQARQRFPEAVLWSLVRQTGRAVAQPTPDAWLFQGRRVKVVDGTTVSMPDTPENQAAYPQSRTQQSGIGFPIARLLVVFSLAVGTVLDAAIGPYQGKNTSERALMRQILDQFQPGDLFLADRFFRSYWVIAALRQRGVDVVVRLHQCRTADFRRGRRLGREDHLVTWPKPKAVAAWMTRGESDAMPAEITVREFRVRVADPTKRVRSLVVVTTLKDAQQATPGQLGGLFGPRWLAELNLRALKTTMHLEILRTKTPAMVRKEVAAHLVASNVIRGIMAETARVKAIRPERLGFQGVLHTVRAFEAANLYAPARLHQDLPSLIELIARKRVGHRPDRHEPRAVKRRPKPHPLLTMPRKKARELMKQGIIPYQKI